MRGLPQVGLVLSAIWIALIGMLAWGRVASPNLTTEAYLYLPKGGTTPKGINPFLESGEQARRPIFVLSILTTTVCLVPHIRKCKRPTGSLYPVTFDERNSRRVDGVHANVLRSPHGRASGIEGVGDPKRVGSNAYAPTRSAYHRRCIPLGFLRFQTVRLSPALAQRVGRGTTSLFSPFFNWTTWAGKKPFIAEAILALT